MMIFQSDSKITLNDQCASFRGSGLLDIATFLRFSEGVKLVLLCLIMVIIFGNILAECRESFLWKQES